MPVSQENIYKIYKAKHFMSYQETGKKEKWAHLNQSTKNSHEENEK